MGPTKQKTLAKEPTDKAPVKAPPVVTTASNATVANAAAKQPATVDTPMLDAVGGAGGVGTAAKPTPEEQAKAEAKEKAATLAKDRAIADRDVSKIVDAVGYGAFNLAETDQAKKLLSGRTPQQMAQIRAAYKRETGRTLEHDIASVHGGKDQTDMMGNVLNGMSIRDKVGHFDTGKDMENLLKHATADELKELTTGKNGRVDRSMLAKMKSSMSPDAYLAARTKLFPSEAKAAVLERIKSSNGYFSDDEGAAMTAFATLPLADRKLLLESNPKMIDFMSSEEQARFKKIAVSEDAALQARMVQATKGAGTDDDAMAKIVEDAGKLNAERKRIDAQLKDVNNPLPDGKRKELEARKAELAGLGKLLEPQRNSDGSLKSTSFLGRMAGDVKDAELHAKMRKMGMPESEVSKQIILDGTARWNDDESGIREAFANLPKDKRQALYDDPMVQKQLKSNLTTEEIGEVESFVKNDVLAMTNIRVDESNGVFAQDEAKAIKSVMDLEGKDREAFMKTRAYSETVLRMTPAERVAFNEALTTGSLSLDTGMKAASEGAGTNEDLMKLTSESQSTEGKLSTRRGYVLSQEGREPKTDQERADLARFKAAEESLRSELGNDEFQVHMDTLVEHQGKQKNAYTTKEVDGPSSAQEEAKTNAGRVTASKVIDGRATDKMGPDGTGGGGLADFFTDTDNTALHSHQIQRAAHNAALADGQVTAEELKDHSGKGETFKEDHKTMVAAQNKITDYAALTAAAIAGTALTIASFGSAGPAVAAALAQYGTYITAGTMAAVTIGTKEAFGGARYDTFGAEGAMDLGTAVLDLGVGKALKATGIDQWGEHVWKAMASKGVGAAPMTALSAELLTSQSTRRALAGQLPGMAVKETVDGTVGNVIGTAKGMLLDENTYTQNSGQLGDRFLGGLGDGFQQMPGNLVKTAATGTIANSFQHRTAQQQQRQMPMGGTVEDNRKGQVALTNLLDEHPDRATDQMKDFTDEQRQRVREHEVLQQTLDPDAPKQVLGEADRQGTPGGPMTPEAIEVMPALHKAGIDPEHIDGITSDGVQWLAIASDEMAKGDLNTAATAVQYSGLPQAEQERLLAKLMAHHGRNAP